MSTYTAVVKQDGDWWIGWVEEVPGVNAQESTREGLVASLKVVLQEALEMNRAEARAAPVAPTRSSRWLCEACAKAATTPGGTSPRSIRAVPYRATTKSTICWCARSVPILESRGLEATGKPFFAGVDQLWESARR